MKNLKFLILIFLLLVSLACEKENNAATNIFVNQIGYFPELVKNAIVTSRADSFKLFSIDENKIVLTKKLPGPQYWSYSDEYVRIADFTQVTAPGKYKIIVDRNESFPFTISDTIYTAVSRAALKAFYYQRASTAIPEKFGGKWARKSGLADTKVYVHPSAAAKQGRREPSFRRQRVGLMPVITINILSVRLLPLVC